MSIADRMHSGLTRYAQLRQHQKDQADFKEKLHRLQQWQVERLKHTHNNLLESKAYRAPTEFILTEIYGGIDLSDLVSEIGRATNKALKVFPDRVMGTAAMALEFNALTAELDEAMTHYLFEKMGVGQIHAENYVEAYANLDNFHLRREQVDLGNQLAKSIDKYVKSKLLYGAFKVARKPAMASGYGTLYGFMDRGFTVLRPIDSTQKLLSLIAEPERSFIAQIESGETNPYGLNDPAQIAV